MVLRGGGKGVCTELSVGVAGGESALSVPKAATSLSPGNSAPRPPLDLRRDVVFLPFCVRKTGPLSVGKGSISDEAMIGPRCTEVSWGDGCSVRDSSEGNALTK
jgi:hypothetical protein